MIRRFLKWLFAETVGATTPEEAGALAKLEEIERAAITRGDLRRLSTNALVRIERRQSPAEMVAQVKVELEAADRAAQAEETRKQLAGEFFPRVSARDDALAAKWITLGREMERELAANDGVCSEQWHRLCDERLDAWAEMTPATRKRAGELYEAVSSDRPA